MREDNFALGPLTRRSMLTMIVVALASTAMGADENVNPQSESELSAEGLAGIPPMIQGAIDVGGVPGVVSAIWKDGKLVQVNAQGFRDIENKLPMERNTIFRIASMSKPIIAVAALRLIEANKMKLDDPITKWAPEFANMRVLKRADGPIDDTYPAPRLITIEDLLTHRSGLSYSFTATGPLAHALNDKVGMGLGIEITPDEFLKVIASLPLAYAPGERFNYGHSTDVLGFIIGRVNGKGLRNSLRTLVFEPLAMNDTDFWIPPAKRNRAAVLYAPHPSGKGFVPTHIDGFLGDQPPSFTAGGQGLVSTIDDFLTFAELLVRRGEVNGKHLLKPESVDLMTSNRLTVEQRKIPFFGGLPMWNSQGFGLGVSVIMDEKAHTMMGAGSVGAYGWPGAFGGWWQADPKQNLILIWLVQAVPGEMVPGTFPRIPGMMALQGFQKRTYAALRN